jgi:flagellar motor switch/type III secretory pathway protein FliN
VPFRLPSLALDVPVTVRLAERPVPIGVIRTWTLGTVIELPAGTGRALELAVDDRRVATGLPVTVDGRVGVRVTAAGGLAERIALVESHR